MRKLNLYGCSFTEGLQQIEYMLNTKFNLSNFGYNSASNFYIFNKFKETAEENSICVIQWSSLTRPFDDNFKLIEISDNPLFDMLEQWYSLLEQTLKIAEDRNIKLVHFTGWSLWTDDELNEYHRNKLNSYDLLWFKSSETYDIIESNCFQFQSPSEWSSFANEDGLYKWPDLKWGGMSEWIRENLEIENRYVGVKEWGDDPNFDPHPSVFASKVFYEQVILPIINEF